MFTFIWFIIILSYVDLYKSYKEEPYVKVTKIECICPNLNLCKITQCRLKPVRRNVAQITVNFTKYIDVVNFQFNIETYRKSITALAYHVFPFNITVDACNFLKNPSRIPVLHYIYDMLANKSSFNHPCPYTEPYIYVENVTAYYLPFYSFVPTGSYMARTKWTVNETVLVLFNIWGEMHNPLNNFLS